MRTSRSLKEVSLELQKLSDSIKLGKYRDWDSDDLMDLFNIIKKAAEQVRSLRNQAAQLEDKLYNDYNFNLDLTSGLSEGYKQLDLELRELSKELATER